MKPISDSDAYGATIARAYVRSVLPDSAITFDQSPGRTYLYAYVGNSGPSVCAEWLDGRYARGSVAARSFRTQQGFLNAVMRATARP